MTFVFKSVPIDPSARTGPPDVREHELELIFPKCYLVAGWVAGCVFMVAFLLSLAFFSIENGGGLWPVLGQRDLLLSFLLGMTLATPAFLVSHRMEVQFLMQMKVLQDRAATWAEFQIFDIHMAATVPEFVPHPETCKSGRTYGA